MSECYALDEVGRKAARLGVISDERYPIRVVERQLEVLVRLGARDLHEGIHTNTVTCLLIGSNERSWRNRFQHNNQHARWCRQR